MCAVTLIKYDAWKKEFQWFFEQASAPSGGDLGLWQEAGLLWKLFPLLRFVQQVALICHPDHLYQLNTKKSRTAKSVDFFLTRKVTITFQ